MRISDWSSDVCSSDLISIVKAWKADPEGNLVYRKTARNFNPNMATAGKCTIAEVEEIVPAGSFDPAHVHTPGLYVDRIIEWPAYEKRREFLTTRPREEENARSPGQEIGRASGREGVVRDG